MALMFAPLKREPVNDVPNAVVVEPTTGTVTAFLSVLNEAKDSQGNFPTGLFLTLRCLVTLHDNEGKFFLASFINYLNECDSETWQYSVSPEDTPRQVFEAVPADYLVRVADHFADQTPHSQVQLVNEAIDLVWPSREDKKGND